MANFGTLEVFTVMYEESKHRIDRIIGRKRDWLSNTGKLRSKWNGKVEKALALDDARELRLSANGIGALGLYHGQQGHVELWDIPGGEWTSINLSFQYHLWEMRIVLKAHSKTTFLKGFGGGLPADVRRTGPTIFGLMCWALVLKNEKFLREIGAYIEYVEQAVSRAYPAYWRERVFEPFVFRLCGLLQEPPARAQGNYEDLGPYQQVLDSWNDLERLGVAIENICEYHCMRIEESYEDAEGEWDCEFLSAPFDLTPVDVWAIYSVREVLGLPTPVVEHPLLSTPVASTAKLRLESDELLHRIEDAFDKLWPT